VAGSDDVFNNLKSLD